MVGKAGMFISIGETHEQVADRLHALAGHLPDRLESICIDPGSQWPRPDPGDPRHRSRHLHPAGPLGTLPPGHLTGRLPTVLSKGEISCWWRSS